MAQTQPDFFWSFLPYWAVAYILAMIGWTAVGRFMMSAFLPPDSPNYIFRFFRLLTEWPLQAIAFITPLILPPKFLPLVLALWAFMLRYVAHVVFANYGMAPGLGVS